LRYTPLIEQFLKEKPYLENVSPRTIILYRSCFKAFEDAVDSTEAVKQRIVELRERKVSPVTINTYLRHIKCYYLWQKKEWTIPWLKEEQKVLQSFSVNAVRPLVNWKPIGRNQERAHIIALAALDTGLRISELLSLTRQDVDFDNLILRVHGKGNKQRL